MKKRVLNLLMCLLVILAMLPMEVSAAASMGIKVIPEVATAAPGDEIAFSIYAGPVEHMQSGQFELYVPEGLTYVANSAKPAKGIAETIGAASVDWTEQTHMFTFYGIGDYVSKEDTLLMTFSCTVDDDATGSLTASVADVVFGDINYEEFSVVVGAAPVEVKEAANSVASESTQASQQTSAATSEPQPSGNKEQSTQSTEGNVQEQVAQDNDSQASQSESELVQESQKESAGIEANVNSAQTEQTGTEEKVAASDEISAPEEKGTSWWWLFVLLVGGAGIGAVVYKKRGGENTK